VSTKLIRALFESHLAAWAGARSPKLRVAYENVDFAPSTGETYLQAFLLPASTDSLDLEGAHRLFRGVWQVSVVAPSGRGTAGAAGVAEELAELFPLNLELSRNTFSAFVRAPMSAGPVIQGESTITVPVSCTYRADTP